MSKLCHLHLKKSCSDLQHFLRYFKTKQCSGITFWWRSRITAVRLLYVERGNKRGAQRNFTQQTWNMRFHALNASRAFFNLSYTSSDFASKIRHIPKCVSLRSDSTLHVGDPECLHPVEKRSSKKGTINSPTSKGFLTTRLRAPQSSASLLLKSKMWSTLGN